MCKANHIDVIAAKRFSSSVLLSVFKRKGGEGIFTKIINSNYQLKDHTLVKEEKPLIIYKPNESYKLLFTNIGFHESCGISDTFIPYNNLIRVDIPFKEAFDNVVKNKHDLTQLILTLPDDKQHILKLENGAAFYGIFQMLHYIARKK